MRDVDPLLSSQEPSTLDPTSSQLLSLSTSQLEDFEQDDRGGDEFDLGELEQSWGSNGKAANEFVSVSEIHSLADRKQEERLNTLRSGQEEPTTVSRKRPHPDMN